MKRILGPAGAAGLGAALMLICAASGANASFKSLYSFQGGGNDGQDPNGNLIRDKAGNLYGTTYDGGGTGCGGSGCGVVFKITSKGKESLLHVFGGGSDGYYPEPGLFEDSSGNLYGTTLLGGGSGCGGNGCGTIFKLSPKGSETVLYAFSGGSDGANPNGALIADKSGNFYGTASGAGTGCGDYGCGTIFEFSSGGTLTTLHAFAAGYDGAGPYAGLVADSKGNFYGTTIQGGVYGAGTIFELTSGGAESVLYAFNDLGYDGEYGGPSYSVTLDSSGDIFTPVSGGPDGCDAVFELSAGGTASLVYYFTGGNDGCYLYGNLIRDSAGNLYGTANAAGANSDGTVFKLTSAGKETTLHAFSGTDGNGPVGGLAVDSKRNLYGATGAGGTSSDGTIFRVTE